MSGPDYLRFDHLLSRYLDDSLSDAEEHELLELLSDGALATRFHEATQLDTEIAGVLAGSLPDEAMIDLVWSDLNQPDAPIDGPVNPGLATSRSARRWVFGAWLALAAALALLLVASAVFILRPVMVGRIQAPAAAIKANAVLPAQPEPAPMERGQISEISGEVYFVGASGPTSLSGDRPVTAAGTLKTVGPDSHATLTLTDGTRIELLGNTTFAAELDPAKRRLFLNEGVLVATVAKQPENNPLIFQTPYSSAIVRGTKLALVARDYDTYLVVFKGAVGLQRASDTPEILVESGRFIHVELSGPTVTWPIARLPRAIRDLIQQ